MYRQCVASLVCVFWKPKRTTTKNGIGRSNVFLSPSSLLLSSRTRLIGLGALSGAVTSEALYNSSTQFKTQVTAIVPALLLNILQADITSLDQEYDLILILCACHG